MNWSLLNRFGDGGAQLGLFFSSSRVFIMYIILTQGDLSSSLRGVQAKEGVGLGYQWDYVLVVLPPPHAAASQVM